LLLFKKLLEVQPQVINQAKIVKERRAMELRRSKTLMRLLFYSHSMKLIEISIMVVAQMAMTQKRRKMMKMVTITDSKLDVNLNERAAKLG